MLHIPVLTKEVLQYLNPGQNENFVDCTVGQGGHAKLILEKTEPKGKVLGIDLDLQQIKNSEFLMAGSRGRLILINDSYANLQEIVEKINFPQVNGILIDLGISSEQLESSGRGFTFLKNEPLDMRYDAVNNGLTAEKIINEWPEDKIENILKEYGEEKFSKKIAKEIIEIRKQSRIKTTFGLIEIIKAATPSAYWRGKIHYATRTFQALRIAVNDELENLKKVLPEALSVLSASGRLAVISFHSLEDRIVKDFFNKKTKEGIIKILTNKPITAGTEELGKNPRSRSAKLRAAIKIL